MRLVLIFNTTILLILCACGIFTPSLPSVNIGFFVDSDCVSACWQGLRPGQSSVNDVEAFLSQNFIELRTHRNENIELTTFSGRNVGWNYQIIATFNGANLVDILLVTDNPYSFDLQIDTILITLGNPEYTLISYFPVSYEMGDMLSVHPYIKLYYPELGYIFHANLEIQSQSNDSVEVCVQEKTNITEIHITLIASCSIFFTRGSSLWLFAS
jgi:hypothetical protein